MSVSDTIRMLGGERWAHWEVTLHPAGLARAARCGLKGVGWQDVVQCLPIDIVLLALANWNASGDSGSGSDEAAV
jgi:hypothetical protein